HVIDAEPNITFGGTSYQSPQHQFQLHSSYDLTRDLTLNASLYCVSDAQSGGVPAYARLDANVTWMPKPGMELQFGIQNACNPEHPEVVPRSGPQDEIETAVYGQVT